MAKLGMFVVRTLCASDRKFERLWIVSAHGDGIATAARGPPFVASPSLAARTIAHDFPGSGSRQPLTWPALGLSSYLVPP